MQQDIYILHDILRIAISRSYGLRSTIPLTSLNLRYVECQLNVRTAGRRSWLSFL